LTFRYSNARKFDKIYILLTALQLTNDNFLSILAPFDIENKLKASTSVKLRSKTCRFEHRLIAENPFEDGSEQALRQILSSYLLE